MNDDEVNVYRVAHPSNNRGPYQVEGSLEIHKLGRVMNDVHSHPMDDSHPLPYEEGLGDVAGDRYERCAFASLDSLYDWFEGWLAQLDNAGYELRTYRVNRRHVRAGLRQVVFDITKAQHVATQRLVEKAAA